MTMNPIVGIESNLVENLLRSLAEDDRQQRAKASITSVQTLSRWATGLLIVALLPFLLLALLLVAVSATSVERAAVAPLALALGVASEIPAVLALVLETVGNVIHMYRFAKSMPLIHQSEFAADLTLARTFAPRGALELKLGEQWLEQRAKRMDRRLAWLLGGSNKVALVTLLLGGSTFWKGYGTTLFEAAQTPIVVGCAVIAGLSVGGLALAQRRDALIRAREIVLLAIAMKAPATSSGT